MNEFGTTQDEPNASNEQRPLSKEEQAQLASVSDLEAEFLRLIESFGKSRELSIAITEIQTAAMWARRHVTSRRAKNSG